MHAHGAERSHRIETSYGDKVLLETLGGDRIAEMPMHAYSETVCERWCATCEKWVEVRGVIGAIKWIAEHEHETESKGD